MSSTRMAALSACWCREVDRDLDGRLVAAAQRHTLNVLNNRDVNSDIGSDGSKVADRAAAAGFTGAVGETIAINPAFGVWSENSIDRSVVVAVYGVPV